MTIRKFHLLDTRIPDGRAVVSMPFAGLTHHSAEVRESVLYALKVLARSKSPWITFSQNVADYEFVDEGEETRIKPKWNALTFGSWDGEPLPKSLFEFWRDGG